MAAPEAESATSNKSLSMVWSGLGLVSAKGVAMLLGFAYWVIAANLFDERTVGLVGAAVAGVLLVGQLSVLGVESSLLIEYPRHASPQRLFDTAFSLVAVTSLVVSALLLGVMALIRGELAAIAADPWLLALFLIMGSFGGVMTVQDHVSMAIKRGDHAIPRNAMNGVVSIVPLLVIWVISGSGRGGAAALFASWVLGSLAGVALGIIQMRHRPEPYRFTPSLDKPTAAGLLRRGLPNHWLTLSDRLPVFITPLLITELISPEANAYWYVVWMASWVTLVVARSMSSALLAEAAQDLGALRKHVTDALASMLGIGTVGAVTTVALAPWILGVMGENYQIEGTAPLRLLVLTFAPYAALMTYYGACRVLGRLKEAGLLGAAMGACLLGGVVLSAPSGLTTVAATWLGISSVFGIVAAYRLRLVVFGPIGAEQ